MPRYAYLDASAIVKLVTREPETPALESTLANRDGLVTSRISVVEVTRAARRSGRRKLVARTQEVFDALVILEISSAIADAAGAVEPAGLRSLDAIHLAAALSLDLGTDADLDFITYDNRLAEAARLAGLPTTIPR